MISHLNKVLLFLIFIAIFYAFTITGRGQELIPSIPIGPVPSIIFTAPIPPPDTILMGNVPIVAVPTNPVPALKPASLDLSPNPTGFQLMSSVTFGGFHNGTPVWKLANGVSLITADAAIHKLMAELEGKKIRLVIEPINQKSYMDLITALVLDTIGWKSPEEQKLYLEARTTFSHPS